MTVVVAASLVFVLAALAAGIVGTDKARDDPRDSWSRSDLG